MGDFPKLLGGKKRPPTSPTNTVYFLTFITQMSAFNAGFEMGATSTAILLIQNIVSMHMTPFWRQLIMAGALPSAAIFSLIGGWFGDRFGRKKCVMFSCFCFILGAILTASANSREVLLMGRLLTGAGMGLGTSIPSVYVAECSPRHQRGCLIGTSQPLFAIGMVIADVISVAFSNDKTNGWRYIWGSMAIFNIFQFVGLLFLPESPSWLLQVSQKIEAKKSLIRLRNDEDVDDEMWEIEANYKEVMTSIKNSGGGNLSVRMLKTSSVRRALIVGSGLHLFTEFSGAHTVIYYSSVIIQMSGIGDVSFAILNTGLVNFINLAFSIIGVRLVDHVGRRPLTIIGLLGLSLSSFCLGTTFLFAAIYSPLVNTSNNSFNNSCSIYSRCDDCIRNAVCGFCYEDKSYVMNGDCLPVSDTSHLISEVGACNSSLAPWEYSMKWAYDYCPVSFWWVALVGLSLFLMFYAISMGPLPWTINAEIYPLWARSTGNGIASTISCLSVLLVSVSFLSFIELIHNYGVFYVMSSVAFVGSIFCFFFLPETKNKSLEEIEELFMTNKQRI